MSILHTKISTLIRLLSPLCASGALGLAVRVTGSDAVYDVPVNYEALCLNAESVGHGAMVGGSFLQLMALITLFS